MELRKKVFTLGSGIGARLPDHIAGLETKPAIYIAPSPNQLQQKLQKARSQLGSTTPIPHRAESPLLPPSVASNPQIHHPLQESSVRVNDS